MVIPIDLYSACLHVKTKASPEMSHVGTILNGSILKTSEGVFYDCTKVYNTLFEIYTDYLWRNCSNLTQEASSRSAFNIKRDYN